MSRPIRARGLKQVVTPVTLTRTSRAPYGRVD